MNELKTKFPEKLKDRAKAQKCALAIAAFAVMAAAIYTFLPAPGTAAHAGSEVALKFDAPDVATQAMIDFALNLRSASEYTVYAEKGIVDRGNSEIRGARADAMRSADGRKSAKALANSIDALRQLPCIDAKGGDLTGRSFPPGVYCLNAAELNGEMAFDGQGNAAATFIFRVNGTLNAKSGSSVRLENGAQGGNVFFVAADVEIGDDAAFRANVLTDGDIRAGEGSTVTGKAMALGKVELNDSAILGGSTGTMRICVDQVLPISIENSLSNRIFQFTVTGAAGAGTAGDPVRVRTGSCSNPFDVAAGPQIVTELNTGSLADPPAGTFTGNFELVDVANQTPASPSTLGLVNLSTRNASVNVVAGDVQHQISLRFTNRRAITGFIEICKRAASGPRPNNPNGANRLSGGDPDVTGFFFFTIEDVYAVNQQNPSVRTLQVFTVPARQCSGPIAVTKGDVHAFEPGAPIATLRISELPRQGFFFERADVVPADRRNGADVLGSIVTVSTTGDPSVTLAPGGGHVNVILAASESEVDETLLTFANRSNPGRVKVCKVAGPGIPIDTLFTFTVTGWGATSAGHPQNVNYGPVTRTVDVRAGNPAQGGTCEFVPGVGANAPGYNQFQTFVNGTPVFIFEHGVSQNNTIPQLPGELRTSQIRVFGSAFAATGVSGYAPNPDLTPAPGRVSRATVVARASIVEVEFSNFRFNPTVLKVCKIGIGSALGQTFNFTVALVSPTIGGANPGMMFPPFSRNLTVTAGPDNGQGGNCMFADGSTLLGGAFNQGSTVTVTEAAGNVTAITSLSAGPGGLAVDLPNRRGTLSGPNGLVAGINSVVFTNGPFPVISDPDPRFDFDGDGKSDPTVFRPSTGVWSIHYVQIGEVRTRGFGVAGDVPVAADHDGDGITDIAVWRPSNGRWYFQGSTGVFEYHQWGEPGDISQPGDYDGDGRADFGIFRPSNATWYIKTRTGQFSIIQFGLPTDKPYAADYDGDGRTDPGVFRNGTWYTLRSFQGFRIHQFGQSLDAPVPADYDGDGAADLAVFRGGTWYMLSATTYTVKSLGTATDVPVPADYDSDGKTDIAVWRPSTGEWFIRRSAVGGITPFPPIPIILGGPGDIPAQTPISYFFP